MSESRFNFTKAAIEALPVPEAGKRAVYHDAKTTGLQIRVTSAGTKTFCIYRRIKGGQPERVTLGCFPEMTIEQARRKAADINAAIEGGSSPAKAKRAHREEPCSGLIYTDAPIGGSFTYGGNLDGQATSAI